MTDLLQHLDPFLLNAPGALAVCAAVICSSALFVIGATIFWLAWGRLYLRLRFGR